MRLRLNEGRLIAMRAIVAAGFISGFLFALVLAASPQLHERIHQPIGAGHECAVTLIGSGSYQEATPGPLVAAPVPALQFCFVPALHPVWVASPFLGARIFEHAPPVLA